jgi:hypothetical protein
MTDDERPGKTEDDESPGPAESAEEVPAPRKRFRAATHDELDPQAFIIADDRSALRAVLRGGSIADDGGDADFIGGVIRRLAQALRESAEAFRAGATGFVSNAQLRKVEFGHSVIVELEISPGENVQMGIDGHRHSPTIDAAHALGQLLAAEPENLVSQALGLGFEAVATYKRFLNLLAGDDVILEWQVCDAAEIVVLTSIDARQDFAILDRKGDPRIETTQVPGKLSMADSELMQFALTLSPDLERPPLLKGKHRVRGTYPEDLGARLKSQSLWDSEVMATLEVTHDEPGTTPTARDPTYVLVDAKRLLPPSAPPLF